MHESDYSSIAQNYQVNNKKNILSVLLFMAPMKVYVTPFSFEMNALICKFVLCTTYMKVIIAQNYSSG